MNIDSTFYGDENKTVMHIQHDEYGSIISEFVSGAIKKYRYAEAILAVSTEIGKNLPSSFDHRVVQDTHDMIAAFFRFKEYSHGSLFKEEIDKPDCIRRWHQFASREIGELLEMPYFARAMILAVVDKTSKMPDENEKAMLEILENRYWEMLQTKPPR